MYYIANFARPKGAKDKSPRKKRGLGQRISDAAQAYITPDKTRRRMAEREEEYKKLKKDKPSLTKALGTGAVIGGTGATLIKGAKNLKGMNAFTKGLLKNPTVSKATKAGLVASAAKGGLIRAGLGGLAAGSALGTVYGVGDKLIRGGKNKKRRKELAEAQAEDYLYRTKGGRRLRTDVKATSNAIKNARERYKA